MKLRLPRNTQKTAGFSKLGVLTLALLPIAGLSGLLLPDLSALRENTGDNDQRIAALRAEVAQLSGNLGRLEQDFSNQEGLLLGSYCDVENMQSELADAWESQSEMRRTLQLLRGELQARNAAAAKDRQLCDPRLARAELRQDILHPVLQLAGADAVGSAVLFFRESATNSNRYYALTSYHVVRDILSERTGVDDMHNEVIDSFLEVNGEELRLEAKMVCEDIPTDLALMIIETEIELGPIARLAPFERDQEVESFSPIYTVGCPLGTAAQATRGEVTRTDWEVGGQELWMISSPAYFGNSGGGVFLEETHELVGIFAKIYTHGSFRPQVVTHMGLAVPLSVIHEWLESEGYSRLLPHTNSSLVMHESSERF